MDLISLCPFPVAAFPWQAQPGAWNLTVCVKATFSLVHGQTAPISATQHALVDDAYWDSNPAASLYAPSDFVPYKPRIDVLLSGHAYAPGGSSVETLPVRMQVGSLTKALTLTGERSWVQTRTGMQPGTPVPFRRMALRYERAALAGENPMGFTGATQPGEIGRPLPSIAASGTQTPGFGPLPLLWRARRRNLPDAAVLWAYRTRLASAAMPQGFDFDLLNSAPAEQQITVLPPHAPIVLENLHPQLPRLETRLPALGPKLFRGGRSAGRPTPVALRLDTVWIDTDRGVLVLSWRGLTAIPGPSDEEIGPLVVALEAEGEPVRSEDIERIFLASSSRRGPPPTELVAITEEIRTAPPAAATPALPAPPPSAPVITVPAAPTPIAPVIDEVTPFFDPDVTQAVRTTAKLRVALPFRADGTGASPPQRASTSDAALPPVLPFKAAGAVIVPPAPPSTPDREAASEPSPSDAPAPFDDESTQRISLKALQIPLIRLARGAPPAAAAPAKEAAREEPESYPGHPAPPPIGAQLFSTAAPTAAPVAPAEPPPMLGAPLFEVVASAAPAGSGEGPPIESDPVTVDADPLSIERCAAIAAELAEQREPRDAVLAANGFTSEAWKLVEEHWAKAIATDARSSPSKLLGAYDAAYIAAIESFRGPVTAEEYGRLLHAMKAGKVNEALAALHIQRTAMTRLMRVWTRKLAEDPQLLRKVQSVTDAGS
ncbi:MAG: DUF2169 domain-containing protein [Byssovorax sp.]